MNVYDFDKTIYDGDSTVDFYLYCVKKYPMILLLLPKQAKGLLYYTIKKIDKTQFKEMFFSFLVKLPDTKLAVNEFWDKNQYKIKSWYVAQQKEDDVIISASPEFLLSNICDRINIHNLLASDVDPMTGTFSGKNCRGSEKVRRFREHYGKQSVDKFYSDSQSDLPMAQISAEAFLVKKNFISKWNKGLNE